MYILAGSYDFCRVVTAGVLTFLVPKMILHRPYDTVNISRPLTQGGGGGEGVEHLKIRTGMLVQIFGFEIWQILFQGGGGGGSKTGAIFLRLRKARASREIFPQRLQLLCRHYHYYYCNYYCLRLCRHREGNLQHG